MRSRDACGPSDIPNLMRAGRDGVYSKLGDRDKALWQLDALAQNSAKCG